MANADGFLSCARSIPRHWSWHAWPRPTTTCVEQALLLGAVAAIEMTSPVDDAAHLIAEAMKGLTFLPVNVVRHLLHTAIPTRELTLEELDLLSGLARGSSIAEQARASNRSRSATYTRLAALRDALGVVDNHAALQWATRRGLL